LQSFVTELSSEYVHNGQRHIEIVCHCRGLSQFGSLFVVLGGVLGAIVTAPLEVVKTRLQAAKHKQTLQSRFRFGFGTLMALRTLYKEEGLKGWYRGLGTHIVSTGPSRGIQFFTYGNTKTFLVNYMGFDKNSTIVHLISSAIAGATVVTVVQPMWLLKTRMQLQTSLHSETLYSGVWDAILKIRRTEGLKAFYKGMGASYLGISESVLQFVLYERIKQIVQKYNSDRYNTPVNAPLGTIQNLLVASIAKLVASVTTYPHEVIRTRLREQRSVIKYKGVFVGLVTIAKEEGIRGLYGGMGPHLMRVVPNAAIMFLTYERVVYWLSTKSSS
jgi:solute carrier family 25 protein 33/36